MNEQTPKIKNHRFTDFWFGRSKDVGGPLTDLRFIVMHYTAGGSGAASRDYMMKSPSEKARVLGASKKVYASAHIVVDRDGTVWQIVPFNLKARHAGTSQWKGLTSLNRYAIGIEIANYGWLDKQGDGSYKRSDTPRFQAENVTIAPMPNGTEIKGWENYASEQLDAVERVTRALLDKYPSISQVLGHQEIAPRRKFDPGPAFPMQGFRNLLDNRGLGALENERGVEERPPERFVTTTRLNIRGGPGNEFERLAESPLPHGTELVKQDEEGVWYMVSLADDPTISGWVHSRYTKLV